MRPKLLVVDDEKNTREALRRAFEDAFEVFVAANLESSKNLIKSEPMDVVLTDLRLGNESGLEVLKLCQRQNPQPPCVVMTAYGSVESAVEDATRGLRLCYEAFRSGSCSTSFTKGRSNCAGGARES